MSIKSDSGLLRKLLFSTPLIFSAQFFALEASAEGEAFYQLLKVLKDKGTLSQDEYESLLNASKEISGSKEKVEKTTIAQTKKRKKEEEKLQIHGNVRVRYQYNHLEDRTVAGVQAPDSRHRGRLRGKIGVTGKPTEGWEAGIGLTSGSDNPRGSNVDLGDTFSTKNILLDYAYIENERTNISWVAGKFNRKKYLWNATDLMWDSDINPEGVSANYSTNAQLGSFWASSGLWVLEEVQNSSDDPYLVYLQLGHSFESENLQFKLAGTKYLYADMNESQVSQIFQHSSNTNTDNNLNAFQLSGEFVSYKGTYRYALIGDMVKNVDTNSHENLAYSVGFQILKSPWKFQYLYAKLEHNSIPDFLPDSDRFNGHTGIKGHEAELQYRLNKSLRLGLDFYSTKDYDTNIKQNVLQADILLNF